MKMAAHTLKSASGYVGAGKLHYACYYVQSTWQAQDFKGMIFYYPLVVEACIEFKRFVRRYLAEYNGKFALTFTEFVFNSFIGLGNEYVEADSARAVELANGYKLAYNVDGRYYCLKDGQERK